ncbi:MAG: nitronate monooxygenase [Alphaproteobacteria bacterium]|jgi:nitronate monooxygenase|nr:nitronate monooxygenase [Alphaproteobacteria bacterium]
MWPRHDLSELLGVSHPIIQAPMAGASTPEMAAAVANAGGLGSLGCARMSPDQLREQVGKTRAATNGAINLNFFCHPAPVIDDTVAARMRERLAAYYAEFELGDVPHARPEGPGFDDAKLEAVLALVPRMVSFHFGLPEPSAVSALKAAGSVVLSSATTVEEAIWLQEAGADVVIAQGFEAGGHRGTFAGPMSTGEIGTMALVPRVVDAVDVPVIAAGGIADGRGIAAAFALGAAGVQIGTAFLSTPEASINPRHREILTQGRETRLTRATSGRPARGVINRYLDEMANAEPVAFPAQLQLSGPLSAAAAKAGSSEFHALWSGQAAALNRSLPAGELVALLVEETKAIFEAST